MSLRTTLKNGLLRSLHVAGAHRLAASYRRDRMLVACYHGVSSRPSARENPPLSYDAVPAEEFTWQLEALARWYRFVDLTEAAQWNGNEVSRGKPPLLITFDDGYRNNLTVAAPILRRLGIPAAFFLTTNYIATDRVLWPTELMARIEQSPGSQLPGGPAIPADAARRAVLADRTRRHCKTMPNADRIDYLQRLRAATQFDLAKVDAEINAFLSWDEARQLAGLGFDIGSHTMEHPILSRLNPDELQAELVGSKEKLEHELGRPVTTIAYPNGGSDDFTDAVTMQAERAGYHHAFAVGDTFHSKGAPHMAIRRMIIPGHAPDHVFSFIASGCRDLLKQ